MTFKEWSEKWQNKLTKEEKEAEIEAIKKWDTTTSEMNRLSDEYKKTTKKIWPKLKKLQNQIDKTEKERNKIWMELINKHSTFKTKIEEYAKIEEEPKGGDAKLEEEDLNVEEALDVADDKK